MPAVDSLLALRSERELLSAHIAAGEDGRFAITFGAASAGEHLFVRFALHYYARVLFELVRGERSARDLPALVERIATSSVMLHGDVFEIAGVQGSLCGRVDHRAVSVDVALCSRGGRELHLRGDVAALPPRLLVKSVPAVLQSILPRLSPDMHDLLMSALANMNASYGVTHRYSDESSLHEVPANAYLAASFV